MMSKNEPKSAFCFVGPHRFWAKIVSFDGHVSDNDLNQFFTGELRFAFFVAVTKEVLSLNVTNIRSIIKGLTQSLWRV